MIRILTDYFIKTKQNQNGNVHVLHASKKKPNRIQKKPICQSAFNPFSSCITLFLLYYRKKMARTYKYSIITRVGMADGGIQSKTPCYHTPTHPPSHLIVQNYRARIENYCKICRGHQPKTYIQFAIGVDVEFPFFICAPCCELLCLSIDQIAELYPRTPGTPPLPLVAYRRFLSRPNDECIAVSPQPRVRIVWLLV